MFRSPAVVMAFALAGVFLIPLGCGAGSESDRGDPGLGVGPGSDAAPGAVEAAAPTSASISAQPEEGDAVIESGATVGLICQWFRGVNIMLSDHAGDTADSVGNWQPLSGDFEAPYHRLTITLEDLPLAPGEYPVTGLKYSVHDDVAGPFNYGWQDVRGMVVVTEATGVAAPEDNGPLHGVTLAGSFDVANNRGGRFTGTFAFVSE